MIKFEHTNVHGIEAAMRGMRNPLMSHDKSDSRATPLELSEPYGFRAGPDDLDLALRLAKAGPEHAKYLRMISVTVDITAPVYYLRELDTYKVGTTCNSSSMMHTGTVRDYATFDFSVDTGYADYDNELLEDMKAVLEIVNKWRGRADRKTSSKLTLPAFRAMRQLMPMSYNYKITWAANYAVLRTIYHQRKGHALSEWSGKNGFCHWVENLPYSGLITKE